MLAGSDVWFADINASLRGSAEEVVVAIKVSHENDPEFPKKKPAAAADIFQKGNTFY